MLEGYSPVTQALLGTLFTWGLTAAGAALVFVFSSRQVIKAEPTIMQSLSKYFTHRFICNICPYGKYA